MTYCISYRLDKSSSYPDDQPRHYPQLQRSPLSGLWSRTIRLGNRVARYDWYPGTYGRSVACGRGASVRTSIPAFRLDVLSNLVPVRAISVPRLGSADLVEQCRRGLRHILRFIPHSGERSGKLVMHSCATLTDVGLHTYLGPSSQKRISRPCGGTPRRWAYSLQRADSSRPLTLHHPGCKSWALLTDVNGPWALATRCHNAISRIRMQHDRLLGRRRSLAFLKMDRAHFVICAWSPKLRTQGPALALCPTGRPVFGCLPVSMHVPASHLVTHGTGASPAPPESTHRDSPLLLAHAITAYTYFPRTAARPGVILRTRPQMHCIVQGVCASSGAPRRRS